MHCGLKRCASKGEKPRLLRYATPPPQQRFLFQTESETQMDVRYMPETIAELKNLLYPT